MNKQKKISEHKRTEIQQNDGSYIIQRMTFPVSERSSLSYHHQGLGAVRFLTAGGRKNLLLYRGRSKLSSIMYASFICIEPADLSSAGFFLCYHLVFIFKRKRPVNLYGQIDFIPFYLYVK